MYKERMNELFTSLNEFVVTSSVEEHDMERAIEEVHRLFFEVKSEKGMVYIIGNGGSAGIASHFCVDLLNVLELRAMTLVDSNVMTCMANDYGYENVYSLPLRTLLKPEDLLVAISSSGESPNIINAVKSAKEIHASVITLSGFSDTNALRKIGDLNFWLPRSDYGLVEMGHFILLHTIVDSWKASLHTLVSQYARQN